MLVDHDFPGFDWENPVLSSFEDWVMGWENETGRMDYKFFWGRMLSAVAKSHKKTARLSPGGVGAAAATAARRAREAAPRRAEAQKAP